MSKCTACGDKPENTAKDFTKAVIEINNPETLVLLRKVVIPASMGDDTDVVPAVGKYHNVILQYEANGHIYLYSSDGIPTAIESNVPQEVLDQIAELEIDVDLLETSLAVETDARERADQGLQQEIDELKNSPDVVDIVATYADLQAYDTSTLGDKDVIRVLEDETHNNESAYYRWDKTNSQWVFIGAVEGYYTKDQTDDLLDTKQDLLTPGENISIEDESGALVISATDTKYTAGSNVQISPQNVISATDTTYTHFTGATASTDGTQGLVPAPVAGDEDKFLSASGVWEAVQGGGGPAVVQTTGTSTADVMSQNATTSMVYPDFTNHPDTIKLGSKNVNYTEGSDSVAIGGSAAGSAQYTIAIGANAVATGNAGAIGIGQGTQSTKSKAVGVGYGALAKGNDAISVGTSANTTQAEAIAIGHSSRATSTKSISIGYQAASSSYGAIALGPNSSASTQGEMNIGTSDTTNGYNNSNYRLISGVYDGQSAHDAATKGQLDSAVNTIEAELDAKQDVLTAGQNITIAEESGALVISATGGSGADVFTTNEWNALWA